MITPSLWETSHPCWGFIRTMAVHHTLLPLLLLHLVTCASCQMNVLFLAADDMRPQLGAYQGADAPSPTHPRMRTPNLDALASRSMLLKRAYVQQAVCNPSRTSLLTSRRPDTTHVYDLVTYFRRAGGNYTTIPQYFKNHGYVTAGCGKIFHPGRLASNKDDPISWTEYYYHAPNAYKQFRNVTWTSIDQSDWTRKPLPDMLIADHAIQKLQEFSAKEKPFFLAAGFHRPHLPFIVPDKYFKYYPMEDIKLPDNPYAPVGMPQIAWSNFDEIRVYEDITTQFGYGNINSTLPDSVTLALRRAYYAAVTYIDDQVGRILDALRQLGLQDSTVVSFWGDHGWQLGEHGEWCKHTNFELATHAPMMVSVPGLTDQGIEVEQLTEFVDLFPTLVDAAGLPSIPLCPEVNSTKVMTCTEGTSLLPLATNPSRKWKTAAFSQYPRMAVDGNIYMGYTMRTERYRYTEWAGFHGYPHYAPNWNDIFHHVSYELYDHSVDPEENTNRAFKLEYQTIRQQLSQQLRRGWRHALPTGRY